MLINATYLDRLVEHDSFGETALAAQQKNKEIEASGINGKIFHQYAFNGRELVISTRDNAYLRIFSEDEILKWEVRSTPLAIGPLSPTETTSFQLPNGKVLPWDWKPTLDGFIGKQFAISASDQNLFLFWRGGEEHMISLLKNTSNDEIYMLINEA
ncbi:hypothetical protein N5J43_01510 [Pseudomonas nicosulfuronedens]|uniref:hypothetical protein n=1 Tax=Pseudomonas nicosulfuronedens TaxID=2571105 RepID=UPI0024492875|nr:hypothetical protein [Pseudomonas nicosulfuronedens]MDH1007561.1 hypothetical protein [Pseudomonas nicosulfuronedens]MDH1977606.1 hypothetical protein [Pseudomonas nicosulfuronedens]MDH2025794.1 hypothetical protein [Pseudomonas nicosulfuronedens]